MTQDGFGFTWLVVRRTPEDMTGLCTDLHAVNTSLEIQGFASGLLCSVVPFEDRSGRHVGLVYLYKQGTFYAFAPHRRRADPRQPARDLGARPAAGRAADGDRPVPRGSRCGEPPACDLPQVHAGLVAVGSARIVNPSSSLTTTPPAATAAAIRASACSRGHEHVQVEALPGRLVVLGLLEPQVRHPAGDVAHVAADGAAAPRLLTAGHQRRPERRQPGPRARCPGPARCS